MSQLLSKMDILYVDHLAVTTPVLEDALADYLSMPGTRLLKGPAENPEQKVTYAFVQLQDGMILELLSRNPGIESPISTHIDHGGGPYHFCYAVRDIDLAIEAAVSESAKLLVKPVPDVAFDGRKVAFLFHRAHGVFELVEAFPDSQDYRANATNINQEFRISSKVVNKRDVRSKKSAVNENLSDALTTVFGKVFPKLAKNEIGGANINDTIGWDSLSHLRLMMELESEFMVSIPAEQIANLVSFNTVLQFLVEQGIE